MIRKIALAALADEAEDDRELLEAEDGLAAQAILEEREVDLVVTDLMMPRLDGLGLIRWANEHRPGSAWIVLSGLESFDNAVEAIHLGALDFLSKPPHFERLRLAVRNALRQRTLEAERQRLGKALSEANVALEDRIGQLEEMCRLLEDQAHMLDRDLAQAEVIQRALLPREAPELDGFCVDTFYRPGNRVGGDLYDVFPIDDHLIAIAIADACGHGVSAAMLSVLYKLHMRTNARRESPGMAMRGTGPPRRPAELLGHVNRALRKDLPGPGMFVTSAYALLDTRTRKLTLSSAGHPPVLWKRDAASIHQLERTGPALGLYGDAQYEEVEIDLAHGDQLLFYTDGLLDLSPLEDAAKRFAEFDGDQPQDLLRALFDPSSTYVGERDDVTMLMLSATNGEGYYDDAVESRSSKVAVTNDADVRHGETPDGSFFSIAGRATWTSAADLFDAAIDVVDRRRGLTLDLTDCEYLDSTVLGTLHEIVARATAAGVLVGIQGLGAAVKPLFEELDMHAVLETVLERPIEAPRELIPLRRGSGGDDQQLRVLHAHETLASLSAGNREQLAQVLEALRAELRRG
jgi:sigma-B regulation protein RsbU (phosphoserine phosphatase)